MLLLTFALFVSAYDGRTSFRWLCSDGSHDASRKQLSSATRKWVGDPQGREAGQQRREETLRMHPGIQTSVLVIFFSPSSPPLYIDAIECTSTDAHPASLGSVTRNFGGPQAGGGSGPNAPPHGFTLPALMLPDVLSLPAKIFPLWSFRGENSLSLASNKNELNLETNKATP